MNRVGDLGFILGLVFVYTYFDTIMFERIFELAPSMMDVSIVVFDNKLKVIELSCFLLFIGAMGKISSTFFTYMVT